MFELDRLKAECSAAGAGRGGSQAVREVIARTKANANPCRRFCSAIRSARLKFEGA